MATYKVLQDIEAEDKLLGPLTLKQFIFAIITVCLGFIAFFSAKANIFLAIPWLLPIAFFGFMATPIGRDQPNDVWLAARIRFLIKPRKRVWDQSGMQELVTITAPKKVEISRTDGLSQTEVKSRLSALSSMMDTRGWAIKNVDTNASYSSYGGGLVSTGERLVNIDSSLMSSDSAVVHPSEDILDPLNNSTAQRIDSAIKQKQQAKLELLKNNLQNGFSANNSFNEKSSVPKESYDFIMNESPHLDPGYATFGSRVVAPGHNQVQAPLGSNNPTAEEEDVLNKLHKNQEIRNKIKNSSHEHRIEPTAKIEKNKTQTITTETAPNAILKELGQANDISVASIANLAKHAEEENDFSDDDVVSLH